MSEVAHNAYTSYSTDYLKCLQFHTTQTAVAAVGTIGLGLLMGGVLTAARMKGVSMPATTDGMTGGGIVASGIGITGSAILAKDALSQRKEISRELRLRRLAGK